MKMKSVYIIKYIIIYISISIAQAFTACADLIFSDKEETMTVETSGFNSLVTDGTFNIVLIQDSSNTVTLHGTNRLDRIVLEVTNDTLFVEDKNHLSLEPGRNTLEIHYTSLSYLLTRKSVQLTNSGTINGSRFYWDALGEIAEARLQLDYGNITICNSANTLGIINLKGQAENLIVFNRYGSTVNAAELSCSHAEVANESAGNIYVNARNTLVAYILGAGNIFYKGDPGITIAEITGKGKVIKISD